MKHIIFVGSVLLLAACGSGGGASLSSSQSANGAVCTVPDSVFTSGQKVQIKSSDGRGDAAAPVAGIDIGISGGDEQVLKVGMPLEVILKNGCTNTGSISNQISRVERQADGGVMSYSWALDREQKVKDLKAAADTDECVYGISQEDTMTEDAAPADPSYSKDGHMEFIKATTAAYDTFFDASLGTRKTVTIAIIDSGVDLTHPEFKNILWNNSGEVAGNGKDDDGNGYKDDVNGYNFAKSSGNPQNSSGQTHGTHVAGLAAAQGYNGVGVAGTMPVGARIMALNVFGSSSGAPTSYVNNAIRYAADNGADVINMSLSGGVSSSQKDAIAYAIKKGVTVLVAAGNYSTKLSSSYQLYPASLGSSYGGLITIGSVNTSSGSWSSFSNYSSTYVELASPGLNIYSTMPGGTYGTKSGTSMATPIATGAAALAIQLIRSLGYTATPARVELALRNGAYMDRDLTTKVSGGAVLNLEKLATYIRVTYPKISTSTPVDPGGDTEPPSVDGGPDIPCS